MKCPACENLLSSCPAGAFVVNACLQGCGGIWFDAFELQKVDEWYEPIPDYLLNLAPQKGVFIPERPKRWCPKCEGMVLRRHFFSRQRQVTVDSCPNCAGVWLDAGELAAIRRENSEAHHSRVEQQTSHPATRLAGHGSGGPRNAKPVSRRDRRGLKLPDRAALSAATAGRSEPTRLRCKPRRPGIRPA